MAGKGPAPNPGAIRRNKGNDFRVVEVEPIAQPALDEIIGDVNPMTGEVWSSATVRFWEELGEFATLGLLREAQWSMLARAMIMDDALMRGTGGAGALKEVRQMFQKFGIAPDDVLRMRVQVVQAEEAEAKQEIQKGASGGRWADLKVVD